MEKEGRLPKKKSDDDDQEPEVKDEDLTQEELKKKKEAEEDFMQPVHEDCFEYKLVGVNIHSGSANGGHYYSFINTNRGLDEEEGGDPTWMQTENDPWMEFNDSIVSNFKFENLEKESVGDDGKSGLSYNAYGSYSTSNTTYGKSAYMLFYERRTKKDLKILVPADKVEEAKQNNIIVTYDEEKKEYSKMVKYRESTENEAPNAIYKKVFEDNNKFTFESEVYSLEFFEFIQKVLTSVAEIGDE